MKHWIHFLDNASNGFIDRVIKLMSENDLLTHEDQESIRSATDYEEKRSILYENYFEKYEDEINDECTSPLAAMNIIKNIIIPRMVEDKKKHVERKESEINEYVGIVVIVISQF